MLYEKLLLILLCLFSFNIITYASFPITENSSSDISNAISFQMAEEEEGEDGVKWWLLIPFVVALGFGAYFLIRAWWRSWRDDIRWVKILTYILLVLFLLFLILVLIGMAIFSGGPMM